MKSEKRSKKTTDERLDQLCGKEAVAEKFNSKLSAKVKNIPQDESNEEDKKQALADEQKLVQKGVQKSHFNSDERKHVAENIVKSVMSYKEEQEKVQSAKDKEAEKDQAETDKKNKVSLVYNCPLPAGTIIDGRYKLQGNPRQGGFGMTYVATRVGENDGALVVVKELYPYNAQRNAETGIIQINYFEKEGMELLKNFKKEAARIEKLKKEMPKEIRKMNLVITKTEAFEYNGNWYYIMEHVPGNSLADIMFSFKDNDELFSSLPIHYRFQIMDQLCNALQNLHNIGCVHQDINPSNIMIDFDDADNVYLKVIDYGLSTNLYNFGDMSRSCIRYAGTHGFSDVLTQFAEYEKISNEIESAIMSGDVDKTARLTEKLKTIDVYSCGAILGYLFLLNIDFIKKPKFNVDYELAIVKYTLVQPIEIDWSEDNIVIANKFQLNLIKKLVSDATARNLNKRVQSVDEFRRRLHEIKCVDEELIRRIKQMSEIELWREKADEISLYVSDYMMKVKPLVDKTNVVDAIKCFNDGVGHLQNADKNKDIILQMEITLDSDLDTIIKDIECINAEYKEAKACFEEAEKLAEIPESPGPDERIIYIENWLGCVAGKADKIKLFGGRIKDKVSYYPKAIKVWDKGLELFQEAQLYCHKIKEVPLYEADYKTLDETVDKTHLADTRYTMAETMWKEAQRIESHKGWIDKLLMSFWSVLVVAGIGIGGYFGWDYFKGKEEISVSPANTDGQQGSDDVLVDPEPPVDVIFPIPTPMTSEYLNEVFKAAQQKDSVAKQRVNEILDDKVHITEKIGKENFNTPFNKKSFFGVGNNKYIIGKTHRIFDFTEGPNDKIVIIKLEELN